MIACVAFIIGMFAEILGVNYGLIFGNYVYVHDVFILCNGTLSANNFIEKDPFGMKSVPIDRAHRDLSFGAGLASQFLRTNEL